MFDSLFESLGNIVDGLSLVISGLVGLAILIVPLLLVIAFARWLGKEPEAALRITAGYIVPFAFLFAVPALDVFFELGIDMDQHPLIFLGATLVSGLVGLKVGKLLMGRYAQEEQDPSDSGV